MSETDVSKMKVADLKREFTGTEKELQDGLQAALLQSFEDSNISDELLDGDVVLTDEEENAAIVSPTDKKFLLQDIKAEEELTATELPNQQTKKIVLKRKNFLNNVGSALNNSFDGAIAIENYVPAKKLPKIYEENFNDSSGSNKNNANSEEKKIIKLSEISSKERLAMRIKKFGITTKENAPTTSYPVDVPSPEKAQRHIQTLKKRAERFGCVLSPILADIEIKNKLQKRKQRFGTEPAIDSASKPRKDIYAEKGKGSLEGQRK